MRRLKNTFLSFKAFFEIVDIEDIVKNYIKFLAKNRLFFSFIAFNFTMLIIFTIPICLLKGKEISEFAEKFITITSIFIPLLLSILILIHYDIERTLKNVEQIPEGIPKDIKREYLKLRLQFLQGIKILVVINFVLSLIILVFSILFLLGLKAIDLSKYKIELWIINLFKFTLLLVIVFPHNIVIFNLIILAFRIKRLIKHEMELIEWVSDNHYKDLDNNN